MRGRRGTHSGADHADHGLLRFGRIFIPSQVGLPEGRFDDIAPEDDHCWFELSADGFEPTAKPATAEVSTAQLVENFAAAKEHWRDSAFQVQNQEMTL